MYVCMVIEMSGSDKWNNKASDFVLFFLVFPLSHFLSVPRAFISDLFVFVPKERSVLVGYKEGSPTA